MPHRELMQRQLRFLQLDEAQNAQALDNQVLDLVDKSIDEILDEFYRHVMQQPELAALFRDRQSQERARAGQKRHWISVVLSRTRGAGQVEQMRKVGQTHVHVGLLPSWYLASYCFLLVRFTNLIIDCFASEPERLEAILAALNKAAFLDMSFVIDSYIEAKDENMRELLRRATRFTEDVSELVTGLRQTTEDISSTANSLRPQPGDTGLVRTLTGEFERLGEQVEQLDSRLGKLVHGDRLSMMERQSSGLRQLMQNFMNRLR